MIWNSCSYQQDIAERPGHNENTHNFSQHRIIMINFNHTHRKFDRKNHIFAAIHFYFEREWRSK